MRQRLFEKLVHNLEDLTKQYRTLLDCVRKEKDFLIQSDVPKLAENNILKEQILMKIRSLDGLRVNYATELAQNVGADFAHPRLLEIAKRMGGAEADRLRTIHSTLELITNRLVVLNKDNSQYATSGLKAIGSAMENLKETLMGKNTYQKKGGYQTGPEKSGHFVSKEA
ncbi:MAG: flagellar protein FlgN [Pseudobdellovibrio sp.]